MTLWKHKIDIKQFINDDDCTVAQRATSIRAEVDRLPLEVPDDILWRLEEAVDTNDVEVLDDALEYLYDWADEERVWLGP